MWPQYHRANVGQCPALPPCYTFGALALLICCGLRHAELLRHRTVDLSTKAAKLDSAPGLLPEKIEVC